MSEQQNVWIPSNQSEMSSFYHHIKPTEYLSKSKQHLDQFIANKYASGRFRVDGNVYTRDQMQVSIQGESLILKCNERIFKIEHSKFGKDLHINGSNERFWLFSETDLSDINVVRAN